ncbi:MAG: hypothetical protein JXA96_11675 [Sedimentisphaerales bacterium]|nr:hypothetical protein [Sedimentisphaerales bacterium]
MKWRNLFFVLTILFLNFCGAILVYGETCDWNTCVYESCDETFLSSMFGWPVGCSFGELDDLCYGTCDMYCEGGGVVYFCKPAGIESPIPECEFDGGWDDCGDQFEAYCYMPRIWGYYPAGPCTCIKESPENNLGPCYTDTCNYE